MANYFPLQAGDRAGDYSESQSSTAADRRPTKQNNVQPEHGENRAPGFNSPEYPLFQVGNLAPSPFLSAPFPVVSTEGDTSGTGTTVHELDVLSYGDCYDPSAPTRVRDVANMWSVDTDSDGTNN